MAPSTLRVVRRPKGSAPRRALTAASHPVDTTKSPRTTVGQAGRSDWQGEAWDMLEIVGELGYVAAWVAASCSRVRLIASEVDPNTGLPTGGLGEDADGNLSAEQQRVAEIVKSFAGGPLGQSQLQRRAAECLYVPGEHWLAILDRGEKFPDGTPMASWFVVTRDEWRKRNNGTAEGSIEVELPDGENHIVIKGRDRFFRVWNPKPRKAREANSLVRSALDPLREIVRTTKKIKVADKSRLIGNGVVFLPAEMSLPAGQSPIADNQPGAPIPAVTGVGAADQLANLIYQQAVAAVEDEDSQAAVVPLLATVPGEHLQKIFHLKIGDEVTEIEIKKRNDAIARLAMSLNISPERLLGLSKGNHWSAWAIGDEDVQTHIKPIIETLVEAINREVLRAVLERENIDPAKYCLWYDASGLTADPDLTDEANKARELGALRNEVYLRLLGLPEDGGHDLTTLEGAQAWAREAIIQDPTLITTLAPLLDGDLAEIEWPTPPPALPPGEQDPDTEDDTTGSEPSTESDDPDEEASVTAAAIPSRAEFILAERLLTSRALELAGKRRFSISDRDQKARLRGLAPHDYHRVMGPVAAAEVPKLISGWDNALADHAIEMLGIDTDTLRAAVKAKVVAELTRPTIDVEAS